MRRREFIALAGASVASPFAAMAQEAGRTYRLGLLWGSPQTEPLVTAFLDEVGRHGFIVGRIARSISAHSLCILIGSRNTPPS